jgi:multidrug resistance protein, MATE family
MGLEGAAYAWNCVQVTSLSLLLIYMAYHHANQAPGQRTWAGWSWETFADWSTYIRVAIPSIIMICAPPAALLLLP